MGTRMLTALRAVLGTRPREAATSRRAGGPRPSSADGREGVATIGAGLAFVALFDGPRAPRPVRAVRIASRMLATSPRFD